MIGALIIIVQGGITTGIAVLSLINYRKYKESPSLVVAIASAASLILFGSSLAAFIPRTISLSVTFLLIPLFAWSLSRIYTERRWTMYAILFCILFALCCAIFAINLNLSLPIREWPPSYYLWLGSIIAVSIGFFILD
jgi:hypothetical protein